MIIGQYNSQSVCEMCLKHSWNHIYVCISITTVYSALPQFIVCPAYLCFIQQFDENGEPVRGERLQLQGDDRQGQRGTLALPELVAGHTVLHLPGPQLRLEAGPFLNGREQEEVRVTRKQQGTELWEREDPAGRVEVGWGGWGGIWERCTELKTKRHKKNHSLFKHFFLTSQWQWGLVNPSSCQHISPFALHCKGVPGILNPTPLPSPPLFVCSEYVNSLDTVHDWYCMWK